MRIEKRTMNWLPKPSLYHEAAAKRAKQKAAQQAYLNSQSGVADTIGAIHMNQVTEMGNIISKIALARMGIKKSA
jgi:hypothetical protein